MSLEIRLDIPEIETEVPQFTPIPFRDNRHRIIWKVVGKTEDENLKLGINNIQGLFLEAYPEFNTQFPREANTGIREDKREPALKFIKRELWKRSRFRLVFGSSVLNQKTVPYFQGSHYVILLASFSPWGINFSNDLGIGKYILGSFPKVDAKTGMYTDSDNQNWAGSNYFKEKYGVDYETARKHSKNAKSVIGLSRIGSLIPLYCEAEVSKSLEDYINLPQISQDGIYTDENQEHWIGINQLRLRVGLESETVSRRLQNVRFIPGKAKGGQPIMLYNINEANQQLKELLGFPKADPQTNTYADEEGARWVSVQYFTSQFGIPRSALITYLKEVASLICRDRDGRPAKFYSETALLDELRQLQSLPEIDKDTGIFVDKTQQTWIDTTSLCDKYGVNKSMMYHFIKDRNIPRIIGRIGYTRRQLYKQIEIESQLQNFLALPRVHQKSGEYIDELGNAWVLASDLTQIFNTSWSTVNKELIGVSAILGRNRRGRETNLYLGSVARKKLETSLSLPQVDTGTGAYVDNQGEVWITAEIALDRWRISNVKKVYSSRVPSMKARAKGKRSVTLYNERLLLEARGDFLQLPRVNQETSEYVDEVGEVWKTANSLAKQLGFGRDTVVVQLEGIRSMRGRVSTGREVQLFNLAEYLAKLGEDQDLPRVERETGEYVDRNNEIWATRQFLAEKTNLDGNTIVKYLEDTTLIRGRDKIGRIAPLYNKLQSLARLNELLQLPEVDKHSKKYIDDKGECWVSVSYFHQKFGVNFHKIVEFLEDISKITGRSANGHKNTLYSEDQGTRCVEAYLQLPNVDLELGKYIDEQGQVWAPVGYFCEKFGLSYTAINPRLKDISVIQGRSRAGRIPLYKESEVEPKLSELERLPQVDRKTGVLVDETGERWAPLGYFHKTLDLDYRTLTPNLKSVPAIRGRDRAGRATNLYNETQLREKIEEFATLPRVDKTTGRYFDMDGLSWVTIRFFHNNYGINRDWIVKHLKEARSLRGRDANGRDAALYNEVEIMMIIQEQGLLEKRVRLAEVNYDVTVDEANKQLKRLLEE